jgi:hypothetical protein
MAKESEDQEGARSRVREAQQRERGGSVDFMNNRDTIEGVQQSNYEESYSSRSIVVVEENLILDVDVARIGVTVTVEALELLAKTNEPETRLELRHANTFELLRETTGSYGALHVDRLSGAEVLVELTPDAVVLVLVVITEVEEKAGVVMAGLNVHVIRRIHDVVA